MEKAELAQKLAELETQYLSVKEEADKVTGLNEKIASLEEELAQKTAAAPSPIFTQEQVEQLADTLIENNCMSAENKVAWVEKVNGNPEELLESTAKIAQFQGASQMGAPDTEQPITPEKQLDPIAQWAMT